MIYPILADIELYTDDNTHNSYAIVSLLSDGLHLKLYVDRKNICIRFHTVLVLHVVPIKQL